MASDEDELAATARLLMRQRAELETSIRANLAQLEEMGVGLEVQLVDAEGYPLPEVDLYTARHLRAETRRMLNDHKDLTGRIEKLLPAVFNISTEGAAFARVSAVTGGTPAHRAGLVAGDLLVRCGRVNSTNFTGMQDLAAQVAAAKAGDSGLAVSLLRVDTRINLTIDLSGGQSLGCLIVPL